MPGRPPKDWFDRCVGDVAAGGRAVDPAGVCGATWARKSPRERSETVRLEEGTMATKKKKSKKGKHKGKHKLHGAALAAWRRAHGVPTGKAAHHGHHAAKKSAKKAKHHHRCVYCGHAARHDAKAGCLHRDARGAFCSCKHRGR